MSFGSTVARFAPFLLLGTVISFFVGLANLGGHLQIGGREGLVYSGTGILLGSIVAGIGAGVLIALAGTPRWVLGAALFILGIGIAVGSGQTPADFCGDVFRSGCP